MATGDNDKREMWSGLGLMFVLIGVGLVFGLMIAIPRHGLCIVNCTVTIQSAPPPPEARPE